MVDQFAAFPDQSEAPGQEANSNGSNDVFDTEQRKQESELIRDRMIDRHNRSYRPSVMSPEYLASLPASLAEKLRVTPAEEEEILYHYASTASIPKTATLTGLTLDKVRSIVYNPETQTRLADLRDAMRISVISKIEETQTVLLDAIQDPAKLNAATLTQIASVFNGISETQLALLQSTREATGGLALVADPSSIFSGEELEFMALMRRRLATGTSPVLQAGPQNDPMDGHEFIDVEPSTPWDPAVTIDEVHTIDEPILQDGD